MSSFVHGCEKPDKDRGAALGPRKLQRVTSLSVDPPQLLVNINRQASSFSLIARHRTFGANILGADQRDIAERFSNGRFKGKERFDGFSWTRGVSGVPLLGEALAALECEVDEIIERYSHGIVVGRLVDVGLSQRLSGLAY
ncbi:flavin reductase family protein [Bradyrhizobium sp. 160]|uniref:flavin reductase family protein n=1 Tax=Bradyrhizobium sp. 160 TaxID=2782634 RepID=UPI002A1E8E65|nr:flavin reductase family protein [Bradyrhizobium sp. 160]